MEKALKPSFYRNSAAAPRDYRPKVVIQDGRIKLMAYISVVILCILLLVIVIIVLTLFFAQSPFMEFSNWFSQFFFQTKVDGTKIFKKDLFKAKYIFFESRIIFFLFIKFFIQHSLKIAPLFKRVFFWAATPRGDPWGGRGRGRRGAWRRCSSRCRSSTSGRARCRGNPCWCGQNRRLASQLKWK